MIVNLFDILTGEDSGGVWSQDGSNPQTVTILPNGDVDFACANSGVYSFTYTTTSGTCQDETTSTITVVSSPSIGNDFTMYVCRDINGNETHPTYVISTSDLGVTLCDNSVPNSNIYNDLVGLNNTYWKAAWGNGTIGESTTYNADTINGFDSTKEGCLPQTLTIEALVLGGSTVICSENQCYNALIQPEFTFNAPTEETLCGVSQIDLSQSDAFIGVTNPASTFQPDSNSTCCDRTGLTGTVEVEYMVLSGTGGAIEGSLNTWRTDPIIVILSGDPDITWKYRMRYVFTDGNTEDCWLESQVHATNTEVAPFADNFDYDICVNESSDQTDLCILQLGDPNIGDPFTLLKNTTILGGSWNYKSGPANLSVRIDGSGTPTTLNVGDPIGGTINSLTSLTVEIENGQGLDSSTPIFFEYIISNACGTVLSDSKITPYQGCYFDNPSPITCALIGDTINLADITGVVLGQDCMVSLGAGSLHPGYTSLEVLAAILSGNDINLTTNTEGPWVLNIEFTLNGSNATSCNTCGDSQSTSFVVYDMQASSTDLDCDANLVTINGISNGINYTVYTDKDCIETPFRGEIGSGVVSGNSISFDLGQCYTDFIIIKLSVDNCEEEYCFNPCNDCTYTMTAVHPSTATALRGQIEVTNNSTDIRIGTRYLVTDCDSNIINNTITYTPASSMSMNMGVLNLASGGFLESIEVTDNLTSGSKTTIDISPTSPYLSGTGGTVIGTDLIFNGSNMASVATNVRIVIINALSNIFGATLGANYILGVQGAGTAILIEFDCKHNPTGSWIGYNNTLTPVLSYNTDGSTPNQTTNTITTGFPQGGVNSDTYSTGCGDISITCTYPSHNGTMYTTINFNNIVPVLNYEVVPTVTDTTNDNITCCE